MPDPHQPVIPGTATEEAQLLFARGFALHQQAQLAPALALYKRVLELQPHHFEALHLLGVIAFQQGEPKRAIEYIAKALKIDPGNHFAFYNRGVALQELAQLAAALQSYERTLALKPDYADAWLNRGTALLDRGEPEAALQSYDQALALEPDSAKAYYNKGNALSNLARHHAAVVSYDRAIALTPDSAQACNSRGNTLRALTQSAAALRSHEQAIALNPAYHSAYDHRGVALSELRRYPQALASHERAITLKPDYAAAYNNRGNALSDLKRQHAALASYERAIALSPDYANAFHNRGNAMRNLGQAAAALQNFETALKLKPDLPFLYGHWLDGKMQICDWHNFDHNRAALLAKIGRNEAAAVPFAVFAITDSPALQKKAAEIWARVVCPASAALPAIPKRARRDRIRVGYFSADFRNHPVSYLMAELFEKHDKSRFELIAFSHGPDSNDAMRSRLIAAFDQFIDVRDHDDRQAAELARILEIDIAVDLGGSTQGSRPGIFALRAAPVQASYLGYLGTMGAPYMDYLIADPTIISEQHQQHYSEKIIYLPSYQANDSQRRIADHVYSRAELGLPETGFVYCCFNTNYKITPATFSGWMRILQRVPGSVLLLYADNALAAANLRKEAAARGVDANRLVIGERLPLPEYLARYRAADLFLDTLPYNAGTTASDALWAGLPVLTLCGEAFASRVAASLLHAIQLPELITETQADYETLAVGLAMNPQRLAEIRAKLARNRLTTPLFDSALFAQHIEAAYTQIYERHLAGLPPAHIRVADQAQLHELR